MYKPYEKRFSKKDETKVTLLQRLRRFSLRHLYNKIKYRIKYHTDYEAAFSLDIYSLEWLYYHLWRFVKDAGKVIDMEQEIYINNKPLKLGEACEMLMDAIKETLEDEETIFYQDPYPEKVELIFTFYGKLAPYLWY